MPNTDPYIFLSYTSEDEMQVRELFKELRSTGYRVWFAKESLTPGQDWKAEVHRAIRDARLILVCLSTNSVAKTGFVQQELREALEQAREYPHGQLYLIPVLLEQCDVPESLSHLQWAELYSESGHERLFVAIRTVLGEPTLTDLRMRADAILNWHLIRVLVVDRQCQPVHGVRVELNELESRKPDLDSFNARVVTWHKPRLTSLAATTDSSGSAYFALSDQKLFANTSFIVSAGPRGYKPAHVVLSYSRKVQRTLYAQILSVDSLVLGAGEVKVRAPDEEVVLELYLNDEEGAA